MTNNNIVRCHIVCEGQSEERFVKNTLEPFISSSSSIYITPIIIPTSKGHKGGGLSYGRVHNFIIELLKNDSTAYVTTFFDYYALDNKFLENITRTNNLYDYIENIENKFNTEINNKYSTDKFFAYIQPHEFESLLFSDINKIIESEPKWSSSLILKLEDILHEENNPEFINNSKETSPSHRLRKIFSSPEYRKAIHGPMIANNIGMETIMSKCSHFSKWCNTICNLKNK